MASRSERGRRLEKLERLFDPKRRLVDFSFRLRVWRCPCGRPHRPYDASPQAIKEYIEWARATKGQHVARPAELLPRIYGGKFDRQLARYVGEADVIEEIPCHEGQLSIVTFDDPDVSHVVGCGSQGVGKTVSICVRGIINAAEWPNGAGGMVGPINERRKIMWDKFLHIARPRGWVLDESRYNKTITLVNNHVVEVLAAKAPSNQQGVPIQGRDWHWAGVDESQNISEEAHQEIMARGRIAGDRYKVFETATKTGNPAAQLRLKLIESNPQARIVLMRGETNPWLDPLWYWERMRNAPDMNDRKFRRLVMLEDVPPELLVYPEFEFERHVGKIPANARNVTAELIEQYTHRPGVKWVAAQDFGVLVTCTEMLQCYEVTERDTSGPGYRTRRIWVARDEVTSGAGVTADIHARRLLERYDADEVLVVADPHFNTKDSDKADYSLFQQQGLHIIPAVHGKLKREHRYSMVNLLLRDDRILIECDDNKIPRCSKLVQSFMSLQRNEYGEAERDRKDRHDMSHWTAALGYGLFPFEKIRGAGSVKFI